MLPYYLFETLHHHQGECYWPIVTVSGSRCFLGKGIIIDDFRQDGTADCESDLLKMMVKIPASWSAQSFNTHPGMPSRPAAFTGFMALSMRLPFLHRKGKVGIAACCVQTSHIF